MRGLLVYALLQLLRMDGWALLDPLAVAELQDALRVSEALRSEMVTGTTPLTYFFSAN